MMTTTNYKLNQSIDFVKEKEETSIAPWWVTGITDAGGKFSIILESKKCFCVFKITQKELSRDVLYDIKNYFKCGEIVLDDQQFDKKDKTYKFIVTKIEDLCNIILPHFDKYPLITSKNLDFLDFRKVVLMCKDGLDLFNIHRRKIFFIINNMNSKRSFDQRWQFHDGLEIQRLNNEWVQAFIDIRGLFYFGVFKDKYGPHKNEFSCILIPSLIIRLKNNEIKLLCYLEKFLGLSYLNIDRYDIKTIKSYRTLKCIFPDYLEIIKFVDKNMMSTYNMTDYEDWKELMELAKKKTYNTSKGLLKMWIIKNSMYSDKIKISKNQINKMPFYFNNKEVLTTLSLDYSSIISVLNVLI